MKRRRRRAAIDAIEEARKRVTEWWHWHHSQHYALTPAGQTVEARLIESNVDRFRSLNHRWWRLLWRKTDNHLPCKETKSASGDGGMGAFVDRAYESIQWDKRCREVQDAYEAMPDSMRSIVQARYVGHWRETPRSFARCAQLLAGEVGPPFSDSTIFDRHKRMLEWLVERLGLGDT